jgi:hypothetical protein
VALAAAADTVLTVYAMYLTLQESEGETERWLANQSRYVGARDSLVAVG